MPTTNLIDRLRSSTQLSAVLGSSRSTYDIRRAMDEGKIVLACPAGSGDKDRLVANFMVYDLLQAALSRKDTPPNQRRNFYALLDEVTLFDGATSGNLAALLEQVAKFGLRALLFTQDPTRLTEATRAAVLTNSSHLATTAVSAKAADLFAREWGRDVDAATIMRTDRFAYLTRATVAGQIRKPFRVEGVAVDEMWADVHDPAGVELWTGRSIETSHGVL